jgi:hypothetical protein
VPLGDAAFPISASIADPPQLAAEDADVVRTENLDHQGNLLPTPSKFAVIDSKSISFKIGWEHAFTSTFLLLRPDSSRQALSVSDPLPGHATPNSART